LQSHTAIFPLGTLSIWANFDGEHYVSVAEGGYHEESQRSCVWLLLCSADPSLRGRSPFAGSSFPSSPSASRSTSSTG